MSLAVRVASWFVRLPDRASSVPIATTTGRVAVLLEPSRGGWGLGAVLGLALAREARVPAVLVLGWRTRRGGAGTIPASTASRRLARTLQARELVARSSGRIIHVTLPDGDADAARAVGRAVAAAPVDMPVVIALGGARGEALDALLGQADLVVVAGGSGDPQTEIALDGAASAARRVVAWTTAPGTGWRRVAHSGVGLLRDAGLPGEALR